MSSSDEPIFHELQNLVGEFEGVVKATLGAAGEQAGAAADELAAGVRRVRDRLSELEKEVAGGVVRRARAVDRDVRSQPWTALGVAAIAAFALGVLVSHRRQSD